jgi:hypothetical protein
VLVICSFCDVEAEHGIYPHILPCSMDITIVAGWCGKDFVKDFENESTNLQLHNMKFL